MSAQLQLQGVSKRYPRAAKEALHDVTLTVAHGEILGVVGASGSGKTTLLRLIAGLESLTAGEISVGETVVDGPGRRVKPEKRGVGLVFQEGALFPHMSVLHNVAYGLHRLSKQARVGKAEQMLALVGLSHKRLNYPHELSGGERQRVALARALAPDPEVILLDEPFSNLDPSLRTYLRNQLLDIIRRVDATALVVTHDVTDALIIADRLAVFREGVLVQCAPNEEVYHAPSDAYCARLFGPANPAPSAWLGQDQLSGRTWVRPHEWELHEAAIGDSVEVEIQAVQFHGDQLGVVANTVEAENDESLLIFVPMLERGRYVTGQRWWLAMKKSDA